MLPCTDCSESLQASREIRPNIIHSSSLFHHLLYPNFVEFQGPFTPCQPVIYGFCPFSSVCLHAFHILPNHHRFQFAAGLPCALSAELLACFVGSCPRCLTRPARRHKRRIARPLAADRQLLPAQARLCADYTQRTSTTSTPSPHYASPDSALAASTTCNICGWYLRSM